MVIRLNNSPHLTLKICSDICPWTLSRSSKFSSKFALRNFSLLDTDMSLDKYQNIFSRQMEATVYLNTIDFYDVSSEVR